MLPASCNDGLTLVKEERSSLILSNVCIEIMTICDYLIASILAPIWRATVQAA
jgi:hypothetical protein